MSDYYANGAPAITVEEWGNMWLRAHLAGQRIVHEDDMPPPAKPRRSRRPNRDERPHDTSGVAAEADHIDETQRGMRADCTGDNAGIWEDSGVG